MSLEGISISESIPATVERPNKAHGECPVCDNRVNCERSGVGFVVGSHVLPGQVSACKGTGLAPRNLRNPGYI